MPVSERRRRPASTADVFLRHGLPRDFIEQLTMAAVRLDEVRAAKVESARQRVSATAAMQDQLRHGRKAQRLLDAILSPRLAKDPVLLAAWRSAKRVRPTTAAGLAGDDTATPLVKVA